MKKVLLTTNSEFGQANVFLAAGHALVASDADVQVHYASFPALSKPVAAASDYAVRCSPKAHPFVFHALDGLSMIDSFVATDGLQAITKRPGLVNTPDYLRMTMKIVLPWSAPQFLTIFRSLVRIIGEVAPDLVVVDALFGPGLTACDHLGVKHILLSPNTIKDTAMAFQPWLAAFWKYPTQVPHNPPSFQSPTSL
jgi:UDP:flavonoid glycosyltransferase YjiC (YdhE family)